MEEKRSVRNELGDLLQSLACHAYSMATWSWLCQSNSLCLKQVFLACRRQPPSASKHWLHVYHSSNIIRTYNGKVNLLCHPGQAVLLRTIWRWGWVLWRKQDVMHAIVVRDDNKCPWHTVSMLLQARLSNFWAWGSQVFELWSDYLQETQYWLFFILRVQWYNLLWY